MVQNKSLAQCWLEGGPKSVFMEPGVLGSGQRQKWCEKVGESPEDTSGLGSDCLGGQERVPFSQHLPCLSPETSDPGRKQTSQGWCLNARIKTQLGLIFFHQVPIKRKLSGVREDLWQLLLTSASELFSLWASSGPMLATSWWPCWGFLKLIHSTSIFLLSLPQGHLLQ